MTKDWKPDLIQSYGEIERRAKKQRCGEPMTSREGLLREAEEHLGFLSNLPGVHPHRIARIREALGPTEAPADPVAATAVRAIRAWQANRQTTFTPTNILDDFGETILTALSRGESGK